MSSSDFEVQFTLGQRTRTIERRTSSTAPTVATAATKPPSVSQVARALALSMYFEDVLDRGEAKDYADLARLACLSRERVSQIVKLRFLSPEIYKSIATGVVKISERRARRIAGEPDWRVQRVLLERELDGWRLAGPALD